MSFLSFLTQSSLIHIFESEIYVAENSGKASYLSQRFLQTAFPLKA